MGTKIFKLKKKKKILSPGESVKTYMLSSDTNSRLRGPALQKRLDYQSHVFDAAKDTNANNHVFKHDWL